MVKSSRPRGSCRPAGICWCIWAWLLCIGVAQDVRTPVCIDTCDAGSQYAKNGVCEERGLVGARCEILHTCLCTPRSDGSDCQDLRPCTVPNDVSVPPLITTSTSPESSQPAPGPTPARSNPRYTTQHQLALELTVSVTVLLAIVYCVHKRKNGETTPKQPAGVVLPSSSPPPIGLICIQVVRAKGLATGRMFNASVRVTVASDRIAYIERKQTAVRRSTYSPAGFSVQWYEDFRIPIVCEDCTISVEVLEHRSAQPDASALECVLAFVPSWNAMCQPEVEDDWHTLEPVQAEGLDQVEEGGRLKLQLTRHAAQVTVDGTVSSILHTTVSPEATFNTASAEQIEDALMEGTQRQKVIRACLEHTQKIMLGAMSAAPMAERKVVYQQATNYLATLAEQPLCSSSLWGTDGGRAATPAVSKLMHQVFRSAIDTDNYLDVQRGTRFVNTVERGPGYSRMYGILAEREESGGRRMLECRQSSSPKPQIASTQGEVDMQLELHTEAQADGLGSDSSIEATTANPLSTSVDDV